MATEEPVDPDDVEPCSMCEQEPATIGDKWPAPVCAACDVWLDGIGADLADMEDADPALAELGRKINEGLI